MMVKGCVPIMKKPSYEGSGSLTAFSVYSSAIPNCLKSHDFRVFVQPGQSSYVHSTSFPLRQS